MNSKFNPIKEDKEGVVARRVIWSTEALNTAINGLKEGKKLVANPFYENNIKLLKDNLVFNRTPEEIAEWKKCAKDILYFAEKYCVLMTPEGRQHIHLRDYQKKYLLHLFNNRLSIYLSARQSGKTTSSAIFILHYLLFNFDKVALVTGNKRKTAVEILDKIKNIYLELPYFIKGGVHKWNESEIVIDNGCRVLAEATTLNTGIGFSINFLYLDEFAHLPANIAEKFYNNIFPTMAATKGKVAISSTQNGYNLFYRIYKSAEAGENDYKAFKTDWDEVPEWNPEKRCWEPRDEAWHQKQIANYGSEEAFNSQFGTEFDVGAKTLLHRNTIRKLRQNVEEFVHQDLPGVSQSENYYWKPGYDPQSQLRQDFIVITGDLAEGVNKDYTVFDICRLIEPGSGKLECIGYYRTNETDRRDVAKTITELIAIQCDINHTLLSFERNTYGEFFLKLIEELQDEIPGFDMSCLVKYYNDTNTRFEYGIKISRGNKNTACILFKEDFEKGLIDNKSTVFVTEIGNFTDSEDKGVWKAAFGHDDVVMSMVQIEFVKKTLQYILLKQDFDAQSVASNDTNYNPYSSMYDSVIPNEFRSGFYDGFAESGFRSIYDFERNSNESRLNRLS